MASRKVTEVTCDVCGNTKQFDGQNTWHRTVWTHVDGYYDSRVKCMEQHEIDICDKCLEEASRLYFDHMKYTLNYR